MTHTVYTAFYLDLDAWFIGSSLFDRILLLLSQRLIIIRENNYDRFLDKPDHDNRL